MKFEGLKVKTLMVLVKNSIKKTKEEIEFWMMWDANNSN